MALLDRSLCVLSIALLVGAASACRSQAPESERSPPSAKVTARDDDHAFVPQHDVDAVDQPDSRRVVARLRAGTPYPLEKRGGPSGAWCKVDIGRANANTNTGWVECKEGGGANAGATGAPRSPGAPGALGAPGAPGATGAPQTPGATGAPSGGAVSTAAPPPLGSGFAFYVLTLSWSPSFCATPAGARSQDQCAAGRRLGFVVHGLWPQNERGWPDRCAVGETPSPSLVDRMVDIMPSRTLIHHEWERHGTCSGLSADGYFANVRAAYDSIRIPDDFATPREPRSTSLEAIVGAFTAVNPRLPANAIAVQCESRLDEVRICLERDLTPRPCGNSVRSACKGTVTVPPLR